MKGGYDYSIEQPQTLRLIIFLVLLVLIVVATVIAIVVTIARGKKIDPTVKNFKQANAAIKKAQDLFYQKTGYYTYRYHKLIKFLKENGYLTEKQKSVESGKAKTRSNKFYASSVIDGLNFKLGDDDFVLDIFKRSGLPISQYLSAYGCEAQDLKRTPQEIFDRITAMQAVMVLAYKKHNNQLDEEQLKQCKQLAESKKFKFTETEKNCLMGNWDVNTMAEISWMIEGVYVLEMVLGLNKKVYPPYMQADMDAMMWAKDANKDNLVVNKDLAARMLDVYYAYAWTIRDQQLHGRSVKKLNTEVVFERYKALLWLFDSEDTPYDEVETDT